MSQKPSALRGRLVLVASCVGVGIVWANVMAVPPSLPAIGQSLGSSQTQLQWISDVYPLVLATLLLPAGALLDRFGRKRGMVIGLVVLFASELWSALATSSYSLIGARSAAGLGAALVFPATLATLTVILPEAEHGRAVSFWAASILIGASFGLMGSAALLEVTWWGSSFLGLAGLTLICIILVSAFVPETSKPDGLTLDLAGAVLALVGTGGLVLAVTDGPVDGWTSVPTATGAIVGATAAIGFVVWELRTTRPLLDLRIFRDRRLAGTSISMLTFFLVDFGLVFLFFQFCEYVFNFGALKSALMMTPALGLSIPAVLIGPAAARKFGLRWLLLTGMGLCAIGAALFAAAAGGPNLYGFLVALSLFWGGIALTTAPATQAIIQSLPTAEQAVASALNDILREFGAAVGVAVLGSGFNVGYRLRVSSLIGPSSGSIFRAIKASPAVGQGVIRTATASQIRDLHILRSGVIAGWQVALGIGAIALIFGVFVAWRWLPSPRAVSHLSLGEKHQRVMYGLVPDEPEASIT